MGTLVLTAAAAAFACWMFKAGKRIGSRKGFNVGRCRARRWRH